MAVPNPLGRLNPVGRAAGLAGGALALLAVGAAAGVAAENLVSRRVRRPDFAGDEPYGSLHAPALEIVTDDGTTLHVEIDEPAVVGSPTLVFCHGYALTSDTWHYQRRDLGDVGRLVFWDQRGHGASGPAGDYTIATIAADLARVLEILPADGPIVLVGHSMGGMTIMELAQSRPELFGTRVQGVALLATSSGGLAQVPLALPGAPGRALRRVAPSVAKSVLNITPRLLEGWESASDLAFLLTKQYAFGSNVPAEVTEFVARQIMGTPLEVIAEFLQAFDTHDTAAALLQLNHVETLVMVGASDRLTPPSHSSAIVRRVPGAEYDVLPDTGHLIMLERYQEVNARLRDLASRVRRNARS